MVDNLPMFAIVSIARFALGSTTASACVFALAAAANGVELSSIVSETAPEKSLTFTGLITVESVTAFINGAGDGKYARIVVDSPGGNVADAIVLGNWIVDHELDVEVKKNCASSCANYLFAAGRRKIIDDGAVIVWHGSIGQKNFRERGERCDQLIRELERSSGDTLDKPREDLANERAWCAWYPTMVAAEKAFFKRVGVDEYITRMGQEPHDFKAIWTVPVSVMNRMGLKNVEVRAAYASHDDLMSWNRIDDPEPILSLGYDASGNVIELVR